ncbi:MAG: phosphodiester glycosidase family protein [Akkermansiaceae bacterium]|jgi:uncharacterized protein YigE (DUF2233 family)|nr:phosphodiester glycosidase family protein [Akkermansiaceae bacterium]MDP4647319.1 phosphodiester glycosidase family protein [Akkermansiaceae bacterium]MDP4722377.1 phosphodiester glycosidase family protein [Akkermansiaceae bacterium]MDP4779471.1 phosphodiester glycosidase family protein [Akkermansiaceae bacterium]MDP4847473.1 phosphodiester glycosidase family protein [Akkermansiaceae bacterium]
MKIPFVFLLLYLLSSIVRAEAEKKVIDGVTYHILRVPVEEVRIFWKDGEGKQRRTFPEVAGYFDKEGVELRTLMNGGIFEPGGVPSGLLVQDGKTLLPVNRKPGNGNFFLMPNGIFLIGSQGAAVIRTDEYPLEGVEVKYAVQSGPLLLREGRVHPAFNAGSSSRLHRNGVGVAKNGEIVMAMSDFHSKKFPNLYEFAELFRSLGCEDALFLDGDISQMRSGADMRKQSNSFGSVFVVVGSLRSSGE